MLYVRLAVQVAQSSALCLFSIRFSRKTPVASPRLCHAIAMSLLHLYQGTPLLRRLEALESIVQLIAIPNDDSKLVQHWARNVHETFNRMHHIMIIHPQDYGTLDSRQVARAESIIADRLEELAARLSSLRPEASERFFYSGQIVSDNAHLVG